MKKILLTLTLLSAALHAQVNIKGATVDATQGYTVLGAAPNNFILCGNGSRAVFAATCGTVANPFYQFMSQNSALLPQRFRLDFTSDFSLIDQGDSTLVRLAPTIASNTTGNAATAANATNATNAGNSNAVGGVTLAGLCQSAGAGCPASGITGVNAGSGWIRFPSGLIYQWMPATTVTESGVSVHSGSWPITFPNAIFSASCSTTTLQGGTGSPGDTDIHAMQVTSVTTSGWTVRHSVGGVYAQAQTINCYLTAIGN